MVSKRKSYTREFKVETVKLVTDAENSVNQVAHDMGTHPNTLYKWIRELTTKPEEAFPGKGHVASDAEIRQLKRENERLNTRQWGQVSTLTQQEKIADQVSTLDTREMPVDC